MALEDRAVAALGLGRHAMVAGELEVLTATYPLARAALGPACPGPDPAPGARPTRSRCCARCASCWPTSSASSRAPSCVRCRPRCCARTPPLDWAASARPAPAAARRRSARTLATFAWPLVGRDDQLSALVGLLEQSAEQPVFAVVTGEPGIGKSRLCAELGRRPRPPRARPCSSGAARRTRARRRCTRGPACCASSGRSCPRSGEPTATTAPSRFRAWESIARTVLDAAGRPAPAGRARRPALGRHLDAAGAAAAGRDRGVRPADGGRAPGATSRRRPASLAELAEMLARRHALRLQLTGLTADEAGEIVTSVAASTPTADRGGRPARAHRRQPVLPRRVRPPRPRRRRPRRAAGGGAPAGRRAGRAHPTPRRRCPRRPAPRLRVALRGRAVLRRADPRGACSAPTRTTCSTTSTRRCEAGLVREFGVDRFRFAHALVRDTAYAALSRSRRARMHARVAEVLAGAARPRERGRPALARRRSAARRRRPGGRPSSAAAAARARLRVRRGGRPARPARSPPSSRIPTAADEDRFALLSTWPAATCSPTTWSTSGTTVRRALGVADERLGDDTDRRGRGAGRCSPRKALWQTGTYGEVDERGRGALRRAAATGCHRATATLAAG